jgi:voltage-gated potassium channel
MWAPTTSTGLPRHGRILLRLTEKPLTAWRAARVIGAATLAIVLVAGILMHWVEPSTYPNVWLGLWWAVQTVTSVGYGDIVPHTAGGRLLALLVMVNGIAFLTVIVATISAAFVESARRRSEQHRGLDDPVLSALRSVERRLEEIERRLDGR